METVFISYSHKDREWMNRLVSHLKVLELQGYYQLWEDRKIVVGDDWFPEIEKALNQAKVIIMMISVDFLTSEFISTEEVPLALKRRREEGVRVVPVIVKPCAWEYVDWVSSIQVTPEGGRVLSALKDHEIDEELKKLAETVYELVHGKKFTPAFQRDRKNRDRKPWKSNPQDYEEEMGFEPFEETSFENRIDPRTPFILPVVDKQTFTGREDELDKLKRLLIDREGEKVSSIVGVTGAGGIGKSALAFRFASQYRNHFPDGVIGLRVDERDVTDVAREMAGYIGHEIKEGDKRSASVIMQQLFAPKRMLLIFDNAEDASVRQLRPGGNQCALVITTRDRSLSVNMDIPEAAHIDLDALPPQKALELLVKLTESQWDETEMKAAEEIADLVGYLPLALEIVGKNMKMRNCLPTDYIARLRDERERLKQLTVRGMDELNVEACLELSLRDLTEAQVRFFANLGACAADGFSIRGARAASCCDEKTAEEHLVLLYSLSLLESVEGRKGRYVFHPLIRLLARRRAGELGLLENAEQQHAQYFVDFVKSQENDSTIKKEVIAEEIQEILLAAEWLIKKENLDHDFLLSLKDFFQCHGYWQAASLLFKKCMEVSIRFGDWIKGDEYNLRSAKFLLLQGKFQEAEKALRDQEGMWNHIEEEEKRLRLEAMWLNSLGGVLQRMGDFQEAKNAFEKSYELEKKLGNERGQAMVLNSLGGVLQRMGNFPEAKTAFEKSYDSKMKLDDVPGQAMSLNSLGGMLVRQGNFPEAKTAFEKSFEISEKLGDERSIAMVQNSLGGVLVRQGNFPEAKTAFEKSFELLIKIRDERGQAMVQNSLGGVLQRMGEYEEAKTAFEKSYELKVKLGDVPGQAMSLNSLGGVQQRMGEYEKAKTAFEKSYELKVKSGDVPGQAMSLNSLGGVLQRMGNFPDAKTAFEKSIQLGEKIGDCRHIAMVQNSFGGVLQRMGNFQEAKNAFEKSFELLIKIRDERGQAMVLTNYGKALLYQNKPDEAIEKLKQGFEIDEKLKDQYGLGIVAPALVKALLKTHRKDEAREYFHRALDVAPNNKKIKELDLK